MVFSVQLRKRARRSLEVECLAADATNPGDIVSGLKNVVFRSGPKMRVVLSRHGQKMELERERGRNQGQTRDVPSSAFSIVIPASDR